MKLDLFEVRLFFVIAFIMLITIVAVANNAFANEYSVNSYEVYDGDTLTHTDVTVFPNIHYNGSIRIRGIDTPEIRTKSACEKSLGYQAKDALKVFLKSRSVIVKNVENGKYAGRLLADLFADGEPVAHWMLTHSHARPYFGGKRNRAWCDDSP